MATRRRHRTARLSPLDAIRLYVGAGLRPPVARGLYIRHRDELLEAYPPDVLGPAAFWSHEPGVPDKLRALDAAQRAYTDTQADALLAARAAWLRTRR